MKKRLTKKRILFFVALFFVLATTFVLMQKKSEPTNPQQIINNTPRDEEGVPQAQIDIGEELAKSDKLSVSNQTIRNIYKDRIITTPQGDAMFFENESYHFTYIPSFEKFIIYIKARPVKENITLAEQDFMRALEITQQTACLLDVDVAVPYKVDESFNGRNFPLSFCQ